MKILISILTIFLLLFVMAIYWRNQVDINSYQGDGNIIKLGAALIDNGYRVEFDDYSLSIGQEQMYHIQKVPNFFKNALIYIVLDKTYPLTDFETNVYASISVITEDKKVIYNVNNKLLEEFSVCKGCYGFDGNSFLYFDSSEAPPIKYSEIKGKALTIVIKFEKRPDFQWDNDIKGNVLYMVGGFK